MDSGSIQENIISLGKLFENYRRINRDKLKRGYPQELKKRFKFLLGSGVARSELIRVTKVSASTVSAWIYQFNEEGDDLTLPKELKIIDSQSDLKFESVLAQNTVERYCAKLNMNNGVSIELTEQGLLLSLNTLLGAAI